MAKTVFISYHFNDKTHKGEVKKWLEAAGATVISTDEKDLRQEGEKVVKARIKEQIDSADMLLILVGDDTHDRPWINYELDVAQSKGIDTKWVRLSARNGAPPPEIRKHPGIDYTEAAITKLL
jgi:MTH538 TIR-like domain (DUF1863)